MTKTCTAFRGQKICSYLHTKMIRLMTFCQATIIDSSSYKYIRSSKYYGAIRKLEFENEKELKIVDLENKSIRGRKGWRDEQTNTENGQW